MRQFWSCLRMTAGYTLMNPLFKQVQPGWRRHNHLTLHPGHFVIQCPCVMKSLLALLLAAMAAWPATPPGTPMKIESREDNYRGWKTLRLANEFIGLKYREGWTL